MRFLLSALAILMAMLDASGSPKELNAFLTTAKAPLSKTGK
jgi:hypothetical protein